jgi:hypothetical protein
MRLLVSGATRTIRRLLSDPRTAGPAREYLGHLILPRAQNRVERILETGLPIACDNGCFKRWEPAAFVRMLADFGAVADWVAMPDWVGNAHATLTLWEGYARVYCDAEASVSWALVAQNGMDDCDWGHFLSQADALFIGGDDRYKESRAVADLAAVAKGRGKLVHMGRVNTLRRFKIAYRMGCDSIDGGSYSRWPDEHIPTALRWLRRLDAQRAQRELFAAA